MKFDKKQVPDLATGGQKVLHVVTDESTPTTFTIVGDEKGVHMAGELEFFDATDLDSFARVLADAWKDHKRLKPRVGLNAAGH